MSNLPEDKWDKAEKKLRAGLAAKDKSQSPTPRTADELERELFVALQKRTESDNLAGSLLSERDELAAALTASRSATATSVPAELLEEAASLALVIAGHFCENPDEWLRGHENRLRELEKIARAARSTTPRTGPDFNQEVNLHADTVAERYDASTAPTTASMAEEATRRILQDYDACGELTQATLNYARAAVVGLGVGPAPAPHVQVVDVVASTVSHALTPLAEIEDALWYLQGYEAGDAVRVYSEADIARMVATVRGLETSRSHVATPLVKREDVIFLITHQRTALLEAAEKEKPEHADVLRDMAAWWGDMTKAVKKLRDHAARSSERSIMSKADFEMISSALWHQYAGEHDVKSEAEQRLREIYESQASPSATATKDDGWNRVCSKCGAPENSKCGWPKNCPTGMNVAVDTGDYHG